MKTKPTPLKLDVNSIKFNSKWGEHFSIVVTGKAKNGQGIEYDVTLKFDNDYWLRELMTGIKSIINAKISIYNSRIKYLNDSK